jgi:hypothetical protein
MASNASLPICGPPWRVPKRSFAADGSDVVKERAGSLRNIQAPKAPYLTFIAASRRAEVSTAGWNSRKTAGMSLRYFGPAPVSEGAVLLVCVPVVRHAVLVSTEDKNVRFNFGSGDIRHDGTRFSGEEEAVPKRPLCKVRRVGYVDSGPASGAPTGVRDYGANETLGRLNLLHLQVRCAPLTCELARLPYRGPRRKRSDGCDRRPCEGLPHGRAIGPSSSAKTSG